MTSTAIPPFCTLLPAAWPTPLALAGAYLVRAQFDPAQLRSDDFAHSAIAPVDGVAKRQGEYLAGRLCARQALQLLQGRAGVPQRGADGAPQWPAGSVGSITHSHGQAAALVAHSHAWQGLGLDLEKQLSPARAARLAGEILTPAELQRASGLDELALAQRVTLTFSLKESLFKALYPLVRQRFYFHDAELVEHASDGQARLRLLLDLGQAWPAGSQLNGQFASFDGYLLSLVAIAA